MSLTITPVLFLLPALALIAGIVTRNKSAFNVSSMGFVAAVVLTIFASGLGSVWNSGNELVKSCKTEMSQGSKTCHITVDENLNNKPD